MENVKVTVEVKEDCVRVLDVEVPAEQVDAEVEKLFGETSRMAQVPGFRPGRVPRKVLQKRFGKMIREQAIDSAVAQSYEEALKSEELSAIADPDIQDTKFEENEPLTYRAVIEIPPRVVELGEYKELALERRVPKVADKDVDQVMENTRQSHAVYVPRDAKPAADDDLLVIDYEGTMDGEPFEGGSGEGVTLVLGQRGFFQEFNEGLRGLIPESETDIKVTFPEDHDRKDLAGKDVAFHVVVKEVKERVLPALDDEFAKDAGSCDTLDEFRTRIREQLEETQKNRAEGELKWQALMAIVDSSSFELPKSAVEHVAEDLFMNKVRQLYGAGITEADIAEREEELRKECAGDAELELKIACVEQEIAKREGLIVTDEEIEQEKTDLKDTGLKGETVDEYFEAPDLRERYRIRMLRRKALDLVIEAARIKEVEVDAQEVSDVPASSEGDDEAQASQGDE